VNSGPEEAVGAMGEGFEFEEGLLMPGDVAVAGEVLGELFGVGLLAGGLLAAGELAAGELAAGELAAGELAAGELAAGELAAGAGELLAAGAGEGLDSAWAGTSVVVVVARRVMPATESVVVTVSVGAAAGTAVAPAWGSQLDTMVPPSSAWTTGSVSR
jgi:hypothetical protein